MSKPKKKRKKLPRSSLRGLSAPAPQITTLDLLEGLGRVVSFVVTHIVRPDGTRTPAPPIYPFPQEDVIETTAEEVPMHRALPPGDS